MNGYQYGKSFAIARSAVQSAMTGKKAVVICAGQEYRMSQFQMITDVLSLVKINYVVTNTVFYLEDAGRITLEVI